VALGIEDLEEGYYKTRLYSKGPWVPIKVWWEGVRENGELVEDEVLRCRWWPDMQDPFYYCEIDPFEWRGGFMPCNFFEPIDKEYFEWLITIKTL
jgi:hypothetical protein